MADKDEIEKTLILMINDYLYYGYNLNFFIKQDYEITKKYGIENLKKLWKKQVEKLGNEN